MKITSLLLLLPLVIAGCQKTEPSEPSDPVTKRCRLQRLTVAPAFDLSFTEETYAVNRASGDIASLETSTGYLYKFIHQSGKLISRQRVFGTTILHYDSLWYGSNGQVALIKGYDNGYCNDSTVYSYGGSYKSQVHFYFRSSATAPFQHAYKTFDYDAQSQVATVNRYNTMGAMYDSYTYTYGVTANRLFEDMPLLDLYLHRDDDRESIIYDALLNNPKLVSTISYTGSTVHQYNIIYELNNLHYPTRVLVDGDTLLTLTYECD